MKLQKYTFKFFTNIGIQEFPGGPVVKTCCFHYLSGFHPWFMVGELRYHKLQDMAKKKIYIYSYFFKNIQYTDLVLLNCQSTSLPFPHPLPILRISVISELNVSPVSFIFFICPYLNHSLLEFQIGPHNQIVQTQDHTLPTVYCLQGMTLFNCLHQHDFTILFLNTVLLFQEAFPREIKKRLLFILNIFETLTSHLHLAVYNKPKLLYQNC